MVETLSKSSSCCSLVQNGKCLIRASTNDLDPVHSNSWIVDSRATDHMTHSSIKFDTYKPSPGNQKITVPNGTPITVAGQGNIKRRSPLPLQNVLYVPKLSTNPTSFHQTTKNPNCLIIFFDRTTGKMIGVAKKKNGLYYLEDMKEIMEKVNRLLLSHSQGAQTNSFVTSNKSKI